MYVCLQLRCLIVVNKKQLSLYSVVSCNSERAHVLLCRLYLYKNCGFIEIIYMLDNVVKNNIIIVLFNTGIQSRSCCLATTKSRPFTLRDRV